MKDYNLFDLMVDNNQLVDAVYFFILDNCQTEYKSAQYIADELNRMHGWDITKVNVYNAVKTIRETALPRYAYSIHSDTSLGYKIKTGKEIPAPVKQLLGLVRNVLTNAPQYARMVYKEMHETLQSSQGLSAGQIDTTGNIYYDIIQEGGE